MASSNRSRVRKHLGNTPSSSNCQVGKHALTSTLSCSSSWTGRKLSSPSIDSHLTNNAQDTGSSDEDLLSAMPLLLPSANGTREYITAYAPSSFYHLGKIPSLSGQEISDAIGRAERAQHGWAQSSWHRRRRVLRSLLVWCEREAEQIARVASRDTGKTRTYPETSLRNNALTTLCCLRSGGRRVWRNFDNVREAAMDDSQRGTGAQTRSFTWYELAPGAQEKSRPLRAAGSCSCHRFLELPSTQYVSCALLHVRSVLLTRRS